MRMEFRKDKGDTTTNASVNSSGAHPLPPPTDPRALAIFFKKMDKFPRISGDT